MAFVLQFTQKLLIIGFIGSLSIACSSKANLLQKPKGTEQQKVSWFRTTFYKLYQTEVRRRDGKDRLRKLIRLFPELAHSTLQKNQKTILKQRVQGKRLRPIDQYFLHMNLMITETIGRPSEQQTARPNSPKPSSKTPTRALP